MAEVSHDTTEVMILVWTAAERGERGDVHGFFFRCFILLAAAPPSVLLHGVLRGAAPDLRALLVEAAAAQVLALHDLAVDRAGPVL